MAISDAERAYLRSYRQRPDVKARDRERAQRRRNAPGGAEINRQRVKNNRAQLGRNYITELVRGTTGIRCRDVPAQIVEMKRAALQLRRLAKQLTSTALEGDTNEA